jgi:chromosome segregation ATPase
MARSPRRAPTVHELDEHLTTVERQLAQVVSTITSIDEAATNEAKWFRDAFVEHRDEVRKGFAKMATADELATVKSNVKSLQTDVAEIRKDVSKISRRVRHGRYRGD